MKLPPKEPAKLPVSKVVKSPFEGRQRVEIDSFFVETVRPGLINPVIAWHDAQQGVWPLVAGQRRLLAAKELGWEFIEALVYVSPLTEMQALIAGWVDNKQRQDLNYVDESEQAERICRAVGRTNKEAAHLLGVSESSMTRLRRMAAAPEPIKIMVRGGLAASTADALLECGDEKLILELAAQVGANSWRRDDVHRIVHGDKPKRAKTEAFVVSRPGKASVVLRGVGKDTPVEKAVEVAKELLADLMKAAKKHLTLGEAGRGWRLAEI